MSTIDKVINVTIDMEGIDEGIIEALTFDLVKPINLTGDFDLYEVDATIVMENNDTIQWCYYDDPAGIKKGYNYILLNGKEFNFNDGDEDMIYEMRRLYIDYLKNKLGI